MEETTTEITKPERFTISNQSEADWVLSLLAAIEDRQIRQAAQYEAMKRQAETDKNAWHARFGGELENFTREELERTRAKRKSLTLFNGTVSFRTVPPRIVIESEADALQTARLVLPSSITTETVERFDKTAFRAYAKERLVAEGEILPGVALTEAREEFGIKFPSAGKVSGEEAGE